MVFENSVHNYASAQLLYFTNWVFALLVFYPWTHCFFNLFFLSLFVFIGGTYFFYIDPGYLIINYKNEVVSIRNRHKNLVHVLFHILPLLFVLFKLFPSHFTEFYDYKFLNAFILIVIYALSINIKQLYFTKWKGLVNVGLITILVYFIVSLLSLFK